jgi:hypothetical protein
MKPFDIESALKGAPVMTRNGRPATNLVKFECESDYVIYGIVENKVQSWTLDGRFNVSELSMCFDLFMAPVRKTGWVARGAYSDGDSFVRSPVFNSEEEAKAFFPNALGYHRIEWEE